VSDAQPISAGAGFDLSRICGVIGGYGSMIAGDASLAPEVTTDEYAADQEAVNIRKTIDYLQPIVQSRGARTLLDVGCGVGAMVKTFLDLGYDAYGVDLPDLHRHWARLDLPYERMCVVDPAAFRLPFADDSIDFAYTLGVIEHVGTSNGHSDRLPDYRAVRRAWLREVFRVVRPGGAALIGGPNRRFPVDVAHDLDSRASALEKWLSARLRVSVHKTWGENFLWAYEDIDCYLDGLPYSVEPQSISGFLSCGRVPAVLRPLVQGYIGHIPAQALGTGLNPWVMALVTKKSGASV